MTQHYARNFIDSGGTIHTGAEVVEFKDNTGDYPVKIITKDKVSLAKNTVFLYNGSIIVSIDLHKQLKE